jgi:hypothetical protein
MSLVIGAGVTVASEEPTHSQISESAKALSNYPYYRVGSPILKDVWVDPVRGNDLYSGSSSRPFKTMTKAWEKIPISTAPGKTGYRINLMPGTYNEHFLPANGWFDAKHGSYKYPIVIRSAINTKKAIIASRDILNFYNCRYLYLAGVNIRSQANNVVHLEKCDHILLKNLKIIGLGRIGDYSAPQEDLKANQCSYIYVEGCEIFNAWNVPLDFVSVKNGHILGNRIHRAGDWCIYLKGGSSHFKIARNVIYDARNGGFSAGQGSGFEWMLPPYIHYETYDIKFVNNIIHDTNGAGMGVQGSYNILMSYNTLYRVGNNSHALEFAHGVRGGWGSSAPGRTERIPNKNVFVYNNIIYNPSGYQSRWSHISVEGPFYPIRGTNIPSPSRADANLVIRGNIFWNGPYNLPLGIEGVNTALTGIQLRSQNYFNTLKPQLLGPNVGKFRPMAGSNIYRARSYIIPDFRGDDYPRRPLVSPGDLYNSIGNDYYGQVRYGTNPPGAIVK